MAIHCASVLPVFSLQLAIMALAISSGDGMSVLLLRY
jgi:hypothetical protein